MKFKFINILSLVSILFLALNGCSKDLPPGNYDASEVGKIKKVVPGVIISKRPITIRSKNVKTETPPSVNPLTNNESASSNTDADMIDTDTVQTHGVEYVIRLDSGSIISVVQSEDLRLKTKQHILVISGNNTRIVPDDGSEN